MIKFEIRNQFLSINEKIDNFLGDFKNGIVKDLKKLENIIEIMLLNDEMNKSSNSDLKMKNNYKIMKLNKDLSSADNEQLQDALRENEILKKKLNKQSTKQIGMTDDTTPKSNNQNIDQKQSKSIRPIVQSLKLNNKSRQNSKDVDQISNQNDEKQLEYIINEKYNDQERNLEFSFVKSTENTQQKSNDELTANQNEKDSALLDNFGLNNNEIEKFYNNLESEIRSVNSNDVHTENVKYDYGQRSRKVSSVYSDNLSVHPSKMGDFDSYSSHLSLQNKNINFSNNLGGKMTKQNSFNHSQSMKFAKHQSKNEVTIEKSDFKSMKSLSQTIISEKKKPSVDSKSKMITQCNSFKSETVNPRIFHELLNELNIQPQGAIMINEQLEIVMYNFFIGDQLKYKQSDLIGYEIQKIIRLSDRESVFNKILDFQNLLQVNTNDSEELTQKETIKAGILDNNFVTINFEINIKAISFIKNDDTTHQVYLILTPYFEDLQEKDNQLIQHDNNFQMVQNIFNLLVLIILIWYIPQDLAFGVKNQWTTLFDQFTLGVFSVDIFINFNLTFEDENEKVVQDRCLIVQNQLKTWFPLDFCATFPVDMLFESIAFNTQILKSFKMIRLFRFLKIFRLMKLQQLQDFLIKSEEIQNFFKKNQGYLDLFKNMLYIQIIAHYQTIIFYAFESNYWDKPNSWLGVTLNTDQQFGEVSLQNLMLFESIKTALGYGIINPYNDYEVYFQIVWMCIGLSLYGYGIGNISSQLNYANQEEIEYAKSVEQFTELCSMNNVSADLHSMIINEISDQQKNYQHKELKNYSHLISRKMMMKIESDLYKEFSSNFLLFEDLNLKVLSQIRSHVKFSENRILLRKNQDLSQIILIVTGQVSVFDERMNFVNKQDENQMMGLPSFQKQIEIKHGINMKQIQEQKDEDKNDENKINRLSATAENEENYKKNDIKNTTTQHNTDLINMKFKNIAIGSENVKYIMLPFEILENIFIDDYENFTEFQNYYKKQEVHLDKTDIESNNNLMKEFNDCDDPGIMTLSDGKIFDLNKSFKTIQSNYISIIGRNLTQVIEPINCVITRQDVRSIDDIVNGDYKMLVENDQYNISIIYDKQARVLQREYNSNEIEYFKCKKSMQMVYIQQISNY